MKFKFLGYNHYVFFPYKHLHSKFVKESEAIILEKSIFLCIDQKKVILTVDKTSQSSYNENLYLFLQICTFLLLLFKHLFSSKNNKIQNKQRTLEELNPLQQL